jgi:hypothetical protein
MILIWLCGHVCATDCVISDKIPGFGLAAVGGFVGFCSGSFALVQFRE